MTSPTRAARLHLTHVIHIDIILCLPTPTRRRRHLEKAVRRKDCKKQPVDRLSPHHKKDATTPSSQSSKTANSDTLLRLPASTRNFDGNGAATFVSLLLGQLPLRPPAAHPSLRRPCNLFALSCNPLRRSLSSTGGKHRPLHAAGSLLDNRLWHKLHCSIDLNLCVMLCVVDASALESRSVDIGPMSFPCWQARVSEERRR